MVGMMRITIKWLNLCIHIDLLRQAPKLRKLGIKIIGQIVIWETAENIMRISETAALRAKFASSVMVVMEQLQLDGIYFQWMWPGCPRVPQNYILLKFSICNCNVKCLIAY